MTTAHNADSFTDDLALRPGFGERLIGWISARSNPRGLNPYAIIELDPHAVLGHMMSNSLR